LSIKIVLENQKKLKKIIFFKKKQGFSEAYKGVVETIIFYCFCHPVLPQGYFFVAIRACYISIRGVSRVF